MARVYVTYVELAVEDESSTDLSPDRLLEAKINYLMELLDINEEQATSFVIRGYYACD